MALNEAARRRTGTGPRGRDADAGLAVGQALGGRGELRQRAHGGANTRDRRRGSDDDEHDDDRDGGGRRRRGARRQRRRAATPATHVASAVTTPTNTTRASSRQPMNPDAVPRPARPAAPRRPAQGPGPPAEAPQRREPRRSCDAVPPLPVAGSGGSAVGPHRSRGGLLERVADAVDRQHVAGDGASGSSLRRRFLTWPSIARSYDSRLKPWTASSSCDAREDAAGLAREGGQELELGRRQGDGGRRRSRGGGPGRARGRRRRAARRSSGVRLGPARTARTRATSSFGLNGLTT